MKKMFKLLVLPFLLVTLAACSSSTTSQKTSTSTSSETVKSTVQLIVKKEDETLDKKVSFKKGESVLDVLKATYKVEEKDGFITSIDGLKQDEAAKKYWLFKVNGEEASKGANEIMVKKGDKIEFYQQAF